VPPGTSAGQVFRLRGQGVPRPGEDAPGDLFVTIHLELPSTLDARTEELVRELERLLPISARGDLDPYRGGGE
jgi:molecular chaperone DnaJ